MADWKNGQQRKLAPLSAPANIIREVEYRGRRIVLTDDNNLVGQKFPDKWGFTTDRGYVVLDEFDEHVFPAGVHWFYTPDDAAAAIELLDSALPTIKESTPTTFTYEYGVMRRYRAEFGLTYKALVDIQAAVDEATQFGDDPSEKIKTILHTLRQNAMQSRGIG